MGADYTRDLTAHNSTGSGLGKKLRVRARDGEHDGIPAHACANVDFETFLLNARRDELYDR
jgi:hypothetical protein